MSWQHGYHTDTPYTCGYYRELSPGWLDFASLLEGQLPPRASNGEPFAYLELGSGMGLGLCLLAAGHPEGQFTGIDFKPDHIVHSRRLARELGLDNIRFEEADFLNLAENPGDLSERHDYVVAHGIATWITEPIQQALLKLAATALKPGGLFYCSYNTFPGWLNAVPLQALAWNLAATGMSGLEAVKQATNSLNALLGTPETPSPLAMALPGLKLRLEQVSQQDPTYLCQEYINGGWQPLSVTEMHSRAAEYKLSFVASATLPENFLGFLPDVVRPAVLAESDPGRRRLLQDIAINQSFRRDVLVKGRMGTPMPELWGAIHAVSVRLNEAPELENYRLTSSFGIINCNADHCRAVERCLAGGARRFADLMNELKMEQGVLVEILSLLLHADRIGLDRGPVGESVVPRVAKVNQALRHLQRQGWPYTYLAAARTGSAVSFGHVENLLHAQIELDQLEATLQTMGYRLNSDPGTKAEAFARRRPWLESLGVL